MKTIHTPSSWANPIRYIKKIYLQKELENNHYAREIIERSGLSHELLDKNEFEYIVAGSYPENLTAGKKVLVLCENRGEFLKSCPSTREYRCCDYKVINIGMGCPMDCVYCILQAYLNNPYLTFFVNKEDMFRELADKLDNAQQPLMRIGTGEFTDSMALDSWTCLSRELVRFFAGRKNGVLELKTKSACIENLSSLDHGGRTVLAWSLNSMEIIEYQEKRVATLEERLDAAAICADWGYHLAFHFDPIIVHKGWQEGYRRTIELLFSKVPPHKIKWISLGAFRYIPKLKQIGTSRFPQSDIFYHEFIEGLDQKQRYFRLLRVDVYKEIYELLKRYADPRTCIYFCMESDEIWQEVMGYIPESKGGIPAMLDATFLENGCAGNDN